MTTDDGLPATWPPDLRALTDLCAPDTRARLIAAIESYAQTQARDSYMDALLDDPLTARLFARNLLGASWTQGYTEGRDDEAAGRPVKRPRPYPPPPTTPDAP